MNRVLKKLVGALNDSLGNQELTNAQDNGSQNRITELTKNQDSIDTTPAAILQLQDQIDKLSVALEQSTASNSSAAGSVATNSVEVRKEGYAVILLDGDCDFFDEGYLRKGFIGGRLAANDLRQMTQLKLASREQNSDAKSFDIWGFVFMTFIRAAGLPNALIDEFFRGFNSSPFPMVAVDCGNQSQAADESLKNWLSQHIQQPSCHTLLIGGAHDGGYASYLHRLSTEQRNKITLIRTSSNISNHLVLFSFPELWYPTLFDGRRNRQPVSRNTMVSNGIAPIRAVAAPFVPGSAPASLVVRSAVPSTSSSTTTSTTTTAVSRGNISYTVLIQAIKSFLPVTRINRGIVAERFQKDLTAAYYKNPDFPTIVNFRALSQAAESAGVVRLGVGEIAGFAWIELVTSETRTIIEESGASAVASTATSQAVVSYNSSAVPSVSTLSPAEAFKPLIDFLKPYGSKKVKCSDISSNLTRRRGVFEQAGCVSWKPYSTKAAALGIIILGDIADVRETGGRTWASLKPEYLV